MPRCSVSPHVLSLDRRNFIGYTCRPFRTNICPRVEKRGETRHCRRYEGSVGSDKVSLGVCAIEIDRGSRSLVQNGAFLACAFLPEALFPSPILQQPFSSKYAEMNAQGKVRVTSCLGQREFLRITAFSSPWLSPTFPPSRVAKVVSIDSSNNRSWQMSSVLVNASSLIYLFTTVQVVSCRIYRGR